MNKTASVRAVSIFLIALSPGFCMAKEIGSVDTKFRALSPDDSIGVEVFDDPVVGGVACYLSRAQIGGFKGALGIAEDTSDASIDCQQVGPITWPTKVKRGATVFREKRSLVFKSLKVVRFCDDTHNAIVYLAYSERIVEGSPKNSLSAVPIKRWPGQTQPVSTCRH